MFGLFKNVTHRELYYNIEHYTKLVLNENNISIANNKSIFEENKIEDYRKIIQNENDYYDDNYHDSSHRSLFEEDENLIYFKIVINRLDDLVDISSLNNLNYLRSLFFYDCPKLKDFSSIKKLENLEVLKLHDMSIEDFDFLSYLNNLKYLGISKQEQSFDCITIKTLINLKILTIGYTDVKNISLINELKSLEYLRIDNCDLDEPLINLNKLKNLKRVVLKGEDIKIPQFSRNSKLEEFVFFKTDHKVFYNLSSKTYNKEWDNLDFAPIKKLTNLDFLSFDGCKLQGGLSFISCLANLTGLHLVNCQLINIDILTKLNNLKDISLSENPNIESLYCLNEMKNLKSIEYENDCITIPILLNTAIKRKDIETINNFHNEYILKEWFCKFMILSKFDEFIISLSKAFTMLETTNDKMNIDESEFDISLENYGDIFFEGYGTEKDVDEDIEKIFELINDISMENDFKWADNTIKDVLRECFVCDDKILEKIFNKIFESKNILTLKGGIEALSDKDLPAACQKISVQLVEDLLKNIEDSADEKILAPAVCLFYASQNLDSKVLEWLNKYNQQDIIFKDLCLAELAKYDLYNNNIDNAKKRLSQIQSEKVKDNLYLNFINKIANESPELAGDMFEEIKDNKIKENIALDLQEIKNFTAIPKNIYRLFLIFEKNKQQLLNFIELLLKEHPESEFTKELSSQFFDNNESLEQEDVRNISSKYITNDGIDFKDLILKFLDMPVIKDYTKPAKLIKFKNSFQEDMRSCEDIVKLGILSLMEEEGLIDNEEIESIKKG